MHLQTSALEGNVKNAYALCTKYQAIMPTKYDSYQARKKHVCIFATTLPIRLKPNFHNSLSRLVTHSTSYIILHLKPVFPTAFFEVQKSKSSARYILVQRVSSVWKFRQMVLA